MGGIKYWVMNLAVFYFTGHLVAQETAIGRLQRQLPLLKDSMLVDTLNQISAVFIDLNKKDSADYYADTAYETAGRLHYFHGMAVALARQSRIAKHFDDDFVRSET
jgi:hypothetical protein